MSQFISQPAPDVVDNLTTNDSTKALSAAQGKALNDKIANVSGSLTKEEGTSYIAENSTYARKVAGLFVCAGWFRVAISIPASTNFARLNYIVPSTPIYGCIYKSAENPYSVKVNTDGAISNDAGAVIPTGYYNVLIVGACR